MTPPAAGAARDTGTPVQARERHATARDVSEFFAPQRTSTSELPDAEPLLGNLTIGVLEVLAGTREPDQLARWLTEETYRVLVTRSNMSHRARSARGVAAQRPVHRVLRIISTTPVDGVVEGVVIVAGPARTRAIAIRLEGWDGRWRATALALL